MDLNQVTIQCKDLERSIRFYQTLGLQLLVTNNHYARFACPNGISTFSLEVSPAPVVGTLCFYFECDDLDERCQQLRQQGVAFVTLPEDKPWHWREARLRDPDGYELCLFWAGTYRTHPPWRLAAQQRPA